MRTLNLLLVSFLLICPRWLHAGDDAAAARAIVEKAIKAAGLDKDDAKPHARTWKDKGTFNFMGQKMEYTAEFIFQAPDKYRLDFEMDAMGQQVSVKVGTDGVKAFESALGMQRAIQGDKLDFVKTEAYQFWITGLTPLVQDKEFKLKTLGEKTVGKHATVGVQVERAGKPAAKLYFGKDTGLLHKLEIMVKNEFAGWKETLKEAYFDDYKDQDGRKAFTKLRVDRGGELLIEATLSDARLIAPVELKRFQEP